MARTKIFQTSFTSGQLDQNIEGRTNLDKYYSGASKVSNAVCMPQGGARKRGGFEYLHWLGQDLGDMRMLPFNFGDPTGVDQAYAVIVSNGEIRVYNIASDTIEATLDSPFLASHLKDMDYTQSYDYMLMVHGDVPPQQLVRLSQNRWSLNAIPFAAIPQQKYSTIVSEVSSYDKQTLKANTQLSKGGSVQLIYNGVTSADIAWDWVSPNAPTSPNGYGSTKDDPSTLITAVQTALRAAAGNDIVTVKASYTSYTIDSGNQAEPNDWRVSRFSGLVVEFSNSAAGAGLLVSSVGNRLIVEATGSVTGEIGALEPMWSSTRGWPMTTVFHENRLWFGGSKSNPMTIYGSRTGEFFNFSYATPTGTIVATDYIHVTLQSDQINRFTGLVSSKTLQMFTSGGEFYFNTEGITPETSGNIARASTIGSERITPVIFDNTTIFCQKNGNSIRDFTYDFGTDGYVSANISALANTLIQGIEQIEVLRGKDIDVADYLVLRRVDGTLAVFSGDKINGVNAWSTMACGNDVIKSISVLGGRLYALIEHTEVTGERHYSIEVMKDDNVLDHSITGVTDVNGSLSGVGHLVGRECVAVDSNGRIVYNGVVGADILQLDIPAGITVTCGVAIDMELTTMPVSFNGVQGNVMFDRKRIVRSFVNLLDTYGVTLTYNNKTHKLLSRKAPLDPNSPIPLLNGIQELFLRGYSRDTRVTIKHSSPHSCTLLGLGIEIEV